jgi:hypothetical protein
VTLGRLVLAWLLVVAWFLAVWWAARRIATPAADSDSTTAMPAPDSDPFPSWRRVALAFAEAGVVTLLGLLVGFPGRFERLTARPVPRSDVLLALLDTVRYLGAGAMLAWRLR